MPSDWDYACGRCATERDQALYEPCGAEEAPTGAGNQLADADSIETYILEDKLTGALANGGRICGAWQGQRKRIRAQALRDCIQNVGVADRHGLYLHNVNVIGELDLEGIVARMPLTFDCCVFDSVPKFEDASLFSLKLGGCCLPGMRANGLELRRNLDLSGSHFHGAQSSRASMSRKAAIWLCDARIGGWFHCVDTRIDSRIVPDDDPSGERAVESQCSVYADRMRVKGPVRLIHDFIAVGQIRLIGARIGGSLDLTGAEVRHSQGQAIDLEDAEIGGSLFLVERPKRRVKVKLDGIETEKVVPERRPDITGRIDMGGTRIASQLIVRKAAITGVPGKVDKGSYAKSVEPDVVIHARRISVRGRKRITRSTVRGGIDLAMSDLSGLYIDDESEISSPGCDALILSHAQVRGQVRIDRSTKVRGTIRLDGATINGDLDLHGDLAAPRKASLVTGSPMTVAGDVSLTWLRAKGGRIKFRGATLGSLNAEGATMRNRGFEALNLKQSVVHGSVRLVKGFAAEGLVVLNRCRIAGRLLLEGGTFEAPKGLGAEDARGLEPIASTHAIEAMSVDVRGGMNLCWERVSPSVDFSDSTTTTLQDDLDRWPDGFTIAGFRYERLAAPASDGRKAWDADARARWLARQLVYDSGPYEQAALVFRQQGYANEAERILIARHQHARRVEGGSGPASGLRDNHAVTPQDGALRGAASASPVPAEAGTCQRRPSLGQRVRLAGRSVGAWPRRAANRLYGLVGFGYRPGRLFWALLGLIGAVVILLLVPSFQDTLRASSGDGDVYSTMGLIYSPVGAKAPAANSIAARHDSCQDGQVRCFSVGLYAIDTVVPLISLDQRSTWYPDQHVPDGMFVAVALDTATILGWVLSSIFVLSFTRFARNNR